MGTRGGGWKMSDIARKCPVCGAPVSLAIDGRCKCGKNNWSWTLYDGHLVLTCNECGEQQSFGVETPMIDIMLKASTSGG
jgi:ribosomal protein S27AE